MTEFRNKHETHIPDDRLPAQSCFENFAERHADGTLKAEPQSRIVSLLEEEQQDARKPDTSRQYNTAHRLHEEAARQHRADRRERSQSQVLDHGESKASGPDAPTPSPTSWTSFWTGTPSSSTKKLTAARSSLLLPFVRAGASQGGDQALQGTINGDQSGPVDRAF